MKLLGQAARAAVAMTGGVSPSTAEAVRMSPDRLELALLGVEPVSALAARRLRRFCWGFGVFYVDTPVMAITVDLYPVAGFRNWQSRAATWFSASPHFNPEEFAALERDFGWGYLLFAKAFRIWLRLLGWRRRGSPATGSVADGVHGEAERDPRG